jgi:hypothetical protein
VIKSWGAFWAFIGLVVIVAFGLWLDLSSPRLRCQYGSYRTDHCGQTSENKKQPPDYMAPALAVGQFLDDHAGALSALTSVIIAAFTVVLALTTRGLSQATRGLQDFAEVQAHDMKQSLAISARAADGAHRSADVAERALDQTSAPYLDVTATPSGVIHRFPGDGTSIQFMDRGVFAEYTIHNYGQSPAIVLEIYQCCIRSPGLPSTISFPPPQSNLRKTYVIGGMKASTTPLTIGYPTDGIDNLESGPPIWITLQIRYRDVFRNQYISTYCAAFNPRSAAFTAYGGQKYNDRRKLTGDELKIAEARDE